MACSYRFRGKKLLNNMLAPAHLGNPESATAGGLSILGLLIVTKRNESPKGGPQGKNMWSYAPLDE